MRKDRVFIIKCAKLSFSLKLIALGMVVSHILLFLGWVAYCSLHSVLAASSVKQHSGLPVSTYRVYYNLFALAGLGILIYWQFKIRSLLLLEPSLLKYLVAAAFLIPGLGIMTWSIIKYFKQLSGLDRSIPAKLETQGLHSLVRHPLYLGTFLALAGAFLLLPYLSNLGTVVIIIIYTVYAIRFEERKLLKIFGDDYVRYSQHVPMIIPFLN